MNVPLIDLGIQYESIKNEIDEAIMRVIKEGKFILGPDVKLFEDEVCSYLGVKYAVGVASGTDALEIALLALGIGTGDEVITTPFTFIATTEAIVNVGAKPVFVDIDYETFCLNPDLIESKITNKTKAILPVKLKYLEAWNDKRRANATLYAELFNDTAIKAPYVAKNVKHSFNYYTVRVKARDKIQAVLNKAGIGNMIYYPLCLHLQEVYHALVYKVGDFPEAEMATAEV